MCFGELAFHGVRQRRYVAEAVDSEGGTVKMPADPKALHDRGGGGAGSGRAELPPGLLRAQRDAAV